MAKSCVDIVVNEEQAQDVVNIGHKVYWPLTGFLRKEELDSVVNTMRLPDGSVWPMPVLLDLSDEAYHEALGHSSVRLVSRQREPLAVLQDIELYKYDKKDLVSKVFKTANPAHPGVAKVYRMGGYLAGGNVRLIGKHKLKYTRYSFTPEETKKLFASRGWRTVASFQTRNVPHRGHEYLQSQALLEADGLFIQPVIGRKKTGDFRDEVIIRAYEEFIRGGYLGSNVCLGVLSLSMRYAGPRSAVWHALIRRNYGCTHFVVGRDHAGVGNYYGSYEAQNVFDLFSSDELGINILKYENAHYCDKCRQVVFENSCRHDDRSFVFFSGTQIRDMLTDNRPVPPAIMRPEVVKVVRESPDAFVK